MRSVRTCDFLDDCACPMSDDSTSSVSESRINSRLVRFFRSPANGNRWRGCTGKGPTAGSLPLSCYHDPQNDRQVENRCMQQPAGHPGGIRSEELPHVIEEECSR